MERKQRNAVGNLYVKFQITNYCNRIQYLHLYLHAFNNETVVNYLRYTNNHTTCHWSGE